jgi:uncharacterized membrane protein YeaQ/YmgE (transglycosylase-associated protein family)
VADSRLIAGFIVSKIVNRTGESLVCDIMLGIIGAIVGGAIFQRLGYAVSPASISAALLSP